MQYAYEPADLQGQGHLSAKTIFRFQGKEWMMFKIIEAHSCAVEDFCA